MACQQRQRRDNVRPPQPLERHFREITRPIRHKTPIVGLSEHAGRTFSRTGHSHVPTVKPMTPLQPLIWANVKPTAPLRPTTAPKTPISQPQRRWRFQPHAHTSEQRRHRFHARDFRCTRAMAGPGPASSRRAEPHPARQAPPVWRAPEGPESQAAVPVGGGGAWPGFEPTRRAKLAARTASGRAAAHGHTKQPGPQDSTRGARNTRGTTSTVQKVRTPRSTPGSGRPGGRRGGRVH